MFPIRRDSQGGRGLSAALHSLKETARSLVFPGRCPGCFAFAPHPPLCPKCRNSLVPFESPHCILCGHLFPRGSGEDHLCAECLERSPIVDKVRAALSYQGALRTLIPRLKYHARLSCAREFEYLLFHALEAHFIPEEFDLIIPMPLHIKKLRSRGFNQSWLLIRHFPELYRTRFNTDPAWKLDLHSLERIRHTPPQTGLDPKARRRNVKGAFCVTRPENIQDRRILLVDDVYTTGATCAAAAQALLDVGALGVDVLVLARA